MTFCITHNTVFVRGIQPNTHDIQSNMNLRLPSCGVFIDLKKTFDTVDQDILLDKLNHCGFRGIINDWFSSYLKYRTQTTQVGQQVKNKHNLPYFFFTRYLRQLSKLYLFLKGNEYPFKKKKKFTFRERIIFHQKNYNICIIY